MHGDAYGSLKDTSLAQRVIHLLRTRGWSVAAAESCTGGQLAADLTTVSGSSSVVVGSAVCYQLRAKHSILGLTDVTEEDVVSQATAIKMANAARHLFNADVGLGTTGYLDGERRAYWAVSFPESTAVSSHLTSGGLDFRELSLRRDNRQTVCLTVLRKLCDLLEQR